MKRSCTAQVVQNVAGVAYQSPAYAIALMHRGSLVEVRRGRKRRVLAGMLRRMLADHQIELVVLGPNVQAGPEQWDSTDPKMSMRLSLRDTKRQLMDSPRHRTQDLLLAILRRYPQMRRFIRELPGTGRLPMTSRWRTVGLVAIAVALAGVRITRRMSPSNS